MSNDTELAKSTISETGMEAPSNPQSKRSGWQRIKFILQAVEVRLRFIVILVGLGLAIAYWDTIQNYWDRWTRPHLAAAEESGIEYYCPMHPSVVRASLDPGGKIPNCPICGMPLSKRAKGEKPTLPGGVVARVQLSPERIQMAGITTEVVDYRPLVKEIRTVGFVDYDESKLSKIVSRVKGFVEKLYVDKTFTTVKEDEPLAELYSPEIYSSVQELLLAKKFNDGKLLDSGRERLQLFGIGDQEIEELLKSNQAVPRVIIRSPRSGHVIDKNIIAGAAVEPGMMLFEVADLSTVWIEGEVFEKDLSMLHAGQEIEATVDAMPGEVFHGQVSLVHPHLETATRTNKIRMTLTNPDHKLRPGMFATVTVRTPIVQSEPFHTAIEAIRRGPQAIDDESLIAFQKFCPVTGRALGSMGKPIKVEADSKTVFLCCEGCRESFEKKPAEFVAKLAAPPADAVLAVPEQAVIDTGTQKLVYVERDPGVFEGVEVTLGPRSGGFYSVVNGLARGDRVAAAGAFLVDAETRLNPAASAEYFGASGSTTSNSATTVMPPSTASTSKSTVQPANSRSFKFTEEQLKNLAKLSPTDRQAAIEQGKCPITDQVLGSMGKPEKIELDGRTVFLCCEGCRQEALKKKDEVLKKIATPKNAPN